MKNVLIISYYWPPSGGSGVQRWLHMSKYFPEFGWRPIIYTAENPEYPDYDSSLIKEIHPDTIVIKRPIKEPYSLYKNFIGKNNHKGNVKAGFIVDENPSAFQKFKINLSIWIRGNFFIPDPRCMWVKPSVKFLLNYLKENKIDAIISTGPPHSMHRIAFKLHKKTNIPWIADFRDPWTKIFFYEKLKLTKLADKIHHKQELEILLNSTKIVTVTDLIAEEFMEISNRHVEVINNGFDKLNIAESDNIDIKNKKKFIISHIGILIKECNNLMLWKALKELTEENSEFKENLSLNLIGHTDASIVDSIKEIGLNDYLSLEGYIPHEEVLIKQKNSDILLLLVTPSEKSKGILTGKIYEYIATGKPILAIAYKDGEIAKLLNKTQSGITIDFNDKDIMKKFILNIFEGKIFTESPNIKLISKYSRRELANKYTNLLNEITE